MKDETFYTDESVQYSAKRYPVLANTYVQHFFKNRLMYTQQILNGSLKKENYDLLEVGCADGIVLRAVCTERAHTCVGIDTAEGMITAAKNTTQDPRISYYLRGTEPVGMYDAVLEVGVINYTDFEADLIFANEHLVPGGIYVLSVAGDHSLNRLFGHGVGYKHCLDYSAYEKVLHEHFVIKKVIPVGIFVPLIWRIPVIARTVQFVIETVLRPIAPNAFHEKLYLLTPRITNESNDQE